MSAIGDRAYAAMFRRLVSRLLLVTILPLVVIGAAGYAVFASLNRTLVLEQHANFLRYHRETIDTFLASLTAEIAAVARQYSLEDLRAGDLERTFEVIRQHAEVFTDIGLIDAEGRHLKYIGPYDLSTRNYHETEWFRRVAAEGVCVSDVFLGFRGVPHFVIAVRRNEAGTFWILRATVNSDYFSRLVDATRIGDTGETFIVNSTGLLQTGSRFAGGLLARVPVPDLAPHDGIRVREVEAQGRRFLYTTTWLRTPRWMLVFRQDVGDVYAPLHRAALIGLGIGAFAMLLATGLAVGVARAQVNRIRDADRDKDALTQRLLVAGKTAAVGEMSAGLAHEINNPLATIDTLRTWIGELAGSAPVGEDDRRDIVDSAAKIAEQVQRCKVITQGLLRFARRTDGAVEPVQLDRLIEEMLVILRTRARIDGVVIDSDLESLPPVLACPAHLQQVLVNLVNNALDAVEGRSDGRVIVRTRRRNADAVVVQVVDNGCGIPPEHLSSIFLPFFTTKEVGKGTGLGLAICYGLVHDMGGTLSVDSAVGRGTQFEVSLPLRTATVRAGTDRQP